ncbi:Intracellular distribution of mitochondria, partial [Coemansia sp. RSA 2320]
FHRLLEPVARSLHLADHAVGSGGRVLRVSADVKGLVGTDGRRYVLDLFRMTPVDVEFAESEADGAGSETGSETGPAEPPLPPYPHRLVLLRPELVAAFWEASVRKAAEEYAEGARGGKDPTASEQKSGEGAEGDKDPETIERPPFQFSLAFSPDAFTPAHDPADSALADAVRSASQHLRDVVVAAFARDLAAHVATPLSGSALTAAMHQRGINMRYLGRIASLLAPDAPATRNARRRVVFEMVARAAKHVLRRLFRALPPRRHAEAFAAVANAVTGVAAEKESHPLLGSSLIMADVREIVAQRFRFRLPSDVVAAHIRGHEHALLREVCVKAGAQLRLRAYYFARPAEADVRAAVERGMGAAAIRITKATKRAIKERVDGVLAQALGVAARDVANLAAVAKTGCARASFADEALDAGRAALAQGQRALGLELLLEALALHEQTFGVAHAQTARCFAAVAHAHFDAGDAVLAAELMARAVVVAERTAGLDDPVTIHNYLNLALYEHARGRAARGLRLLRHALRLWAVVDAPDHPDLPTAFNNVGVMLQALRRYADAQRFFRASLDARAALLGPDHVLVASAHHSLAKAHALAGDFAAALHAERAAHLLFTAALGDDDPRSRETAAWLAEFTANAVRSARLSKSARERLRDAVDAVGAVAAAEQSDHPPPPPPPSKGHLPIDELLKFITGSSAPKPRGARRAKGPKGSKR